MRELIRGLSAGLGPGLLVGLVPLIVVAVAGLIVLLRRRWALTLALALPGFLTAVFLLVQGLSFSPRFFLLWLPVATLVAVQGVYTIVALFSNYLHVTTRIFVPRMATILVLIGLATSLSSLKHYYLVPKQSYRASLDYIEAQRQPGDPIITIYLSEHGYRFYGRRFGLKEGEDWFPVRSVESLDSVLSKTRGHPSIVVTTFARALRFSHPDLLKRILEGWIQDRTFPATIGDGEISVWKERPADRELSFDKN